MRFCSSAALALPLIALAACNQKAETAPPTTEVAQNNAGVTDSLDGAAPAMARAALSMADGKSVGDATATETPDGLLIAVNGIALPAGTHGIHIHMTGKCEGPKFESAGAHWNPAGRKHGSESPDGQHAGDLPNLVVAANGAGTLTFTIPNAALSGGAEALLDGDGAAMVIHDKPDDLKTDPTGASGDRIACGVFSAA
ncbi:superoxide dismutase family protein [Sphingomonas sp. SCN 67-18]|uniref:superoxide dismutase family protein n=1 Tax=uncultured Sphingomonas sp. TaxID=158754 RepID=UPI000AD909C5|nr:superoxide dismutase family protein [Sphingomonas sp. SCN 67-18]